MYRRITYILLLVCFYTLSYSQITQKFNSPPSIVNANNGLTKTSSVIGLGGTLIQNTNIALNGNNLTTTGLGELDFESEIGLNEVVNIQTTANILGFGIKGGAITYNKSPTPTVVYAGVGDFTAGGGDDNQATLCTFNPVSGRVAQFIVQDDFSANPRAQVLLVDDLSNAYAVNFRPSNIQIGSTAAYTLPWNAGSSGQLLKLSGSDLTFQDDATLYNTNGILTSNRTLDGDVTERYSLTLDELGDFTVNANGGGNEGFDGDIDLNSANEINIAANSGVNAIKLQTSNISIGDDVGLTNYTIPYTRGTSGQVLVSNAVGVVTWQNGLWNQTDLTLTNNRSHTGNGIQKYSLAYTSLGEFNINVETGGLAGHPGNIVLSAQNNINLSPRIDCGLPAYADDAAAGVAGLTAGRWYQTDGTGAAPLNVAGIVLVKQ